MLLRAAGEEISISYIDQAAPRPLRRSDLLQQYFFDIDAGAGPAPVAAAEHELSMGSGAAAVQGGVQVHLAPPSPLDVGREALTAVTGTKPPKTELPSPNPEQRSAPTPCRARQALHHLAIH